MSAHAHRQARLPAAATCRHASTLACMQATGALTPLARFTVRNLWLAFTSTQGKALGLQLSLPWVEGEDMRPWVPREHALVISSADSAPDAARTPASLLTMQWAATAELAHQKLQVQLLPSCLIPVRCPCAVWCSAKCCALHSSTCCTPCQR